MRRLASRFTNGTITGQTKFDCLNRFPHRDLGCVACLRSFPLRFRSGLKAVSVEMTVQSQDLLNAVLDVRRYGLVVETELCLADEVEAAGDQD